MGATMSLLRAWINGITGFIVATAALTVAMTIAITGPPTAAEMSGLQAFLARAGTELVTAAEDVGDEACAQVPELCAPQTRTVTAQTTSGAEPANAVQSPLVAPEIEITPSPTPQEALPAEDAGLLGGVGGDDRAVQDRSRTATPRVERRQATPVERRAAPVRRARDLRRAPRPPVAVARIDPYSSLPDAPASPLEELIAAQPPEILPEPELPTQSEAEPVRAREEAWPTQWEAVPAEEEAYPENEGYFDEEAAYQAERERIYAEREARRRYRERVRAYREWRRQAEGW